VGGLLAEGQIHRDVAGWQTSVDSEGQLRRLPMVPGAFRLTLAEALRELPDGMSYVDDCSWAFSFTGKKDFQEQTKAQLDNI